MNTCILIPSCSAFRDCWPATLACIEKFWPDRQWTVRTVSDSIPWGDNPIVVPEDLGWSANLRFALTKISEEFVVMFLEDMLITRQVNSGDLQLASDAIQSHPEVGAIRIGQGITPHEPIDSVMSRLLPCEMYRLTTGPTLWRASYLREMAESCGPTPWDFEHHSTRRSCELPQEVWTLYGDDETKRPIYTFYSAITRGLWNPIAVEWLKNEVGIQVDISRGLMS